MVHRMVPSYVKIESMIIIFTVVYYGIKAGQYFPAWILPEIFLQITPIN